MELQRIMELLNKTHKSQKELCDYLGLKQQTFTEWKAGRNQSYLKRLSDIAEFFGMTKQQLLSGEEPGTLPPMGADTPQTDPRFAALTAIWNCCTEPAKDDILQFAIKRSTETDIEEKAN